MPASLIQPLQDVDRDISAMRERIIAQRRQIIELQKHGHTAAGYITLLRELENALRLMQIRREGIVFRLRRQERQHGRTKEVSSSRR
jgi:hypothetical protein